MAATHGIRALGVLGAGQMGTFTSFKVRSVESPRTPGCSDVPCHEAVHGSQLHDCNQGLRLRGNSLCGYTIPTTRQQLTPRSFSFSEVVGRRTSVIPRGYIAGSRSHIINTKRSTLCLFFLAPLLSGHVLRRGPRSRHNICGGAPCTRTSFAPRSFDGPNTNRTESHG